MSNHFEVLVIGGGPAGMMAAIAAAENGANVALLEKNKKFGKKLRLTGGGRCNVTNNKSVDELIRHIPGNGRFLYSTFSQWNNLDIMNFFAEQQVPLKEEDHGRMFPVTDKSQTIVEALVGRLKELNVTLIPQATVQKLLFQEDLLCGIATEHEKFYASAVLVTTGGKTYPSTGSTGDGYQFAKRVGHSITPLYPTESPLISEEDFIKKRLLQGLSLQDISLSVLDQKGKVVTEHTMDLLFTHFGLSGPAALRCSSFVNQLLKKQETVTVRLDCFPMSSELELIKNLTSLLSQSKKQAKNALNGWLPERLLQFLLENLQLEDIPGPQIPQEKIKELAQSAKQFDIQIIRTFGLEKSFVTGGGVELKEVVPKTLESKLCPGLFFAGEVLDINGYTGGYNITTALCTGHVAGTHAAEYASWFRT